MAERLAAPDEIGRSLSAGRAANAAALQILPESCASRFWRCECTLVRQSSRNRPVLIVKTPSSRRNTCVSSYENNSEWICVNELGIKRPSTCH
jgi:hypothetical protein